MPYGGFKSSINSLYQFIFFVDVLQHYLRKMGRIWEPTEGSPGVLSRGKSARTGHCATSNVACQECTGLASSWENCFPFLWCILCTARVCGRSSLRRASSMLLFELIKAPSYDLISRAVYRTNDQPKELALCFYAVSFGRRAPPSHSLLLSFLKTCFLKCFLGSYLSIAPYLSCKMTLSQWHSFKLKPEMQISGSIYLSLDRFKNKNIQYLKMNILGTVINLLTV